MQSNKPQHKTQSGRKRLQKKKRVGINSHLTQLHSHFNAPCGVGTLTSLVDKGVGKGREVWLQREYKAQAEGELRKQW